jgi:hypothetical protein
MKQLLIGLMLLGILATVGGCAAAPQPPGREPEMMFDVSPAALPQPPAAPREVLATDLAVSDTERMIVRTADLSLVVTDAEPAMRSIQELVVGMGGYVTNSSAWREGEQLRARLSVRVPAAALDRAMDAIKRLAVRVQRENTTGQDVTEEYTDLNARLVNLEATEKELRELLAEVRRRTQRAEDILQVYRELTNIRGEIERVKGRMQYLSNLTAMATLNIELIPDILARPVVEPGWRPLETLKNAGRALVNTLKGLVDVSIWLVVYVVPLLIIAAIPIVLVILAIRWLVRRRRQ